MKLLVIIYCCSHVHSNMCSWAIKENSTFTAYRSSSVQSVLTMHTLNMNVMIIVAFLFYCRIAEGAEDYRRVCLVKHSQDFSYKNQYSWRRLEGSKCGGSQQSPINIKKRQVKSNVRYIKPLVLRNWGNPMSGCWVNNGHTLSFKPHAGQHKPYLDTFVKRGYQFQQFHFHWGKGYRSGGSEHRINGRSFSGEMHFVFSHPRTRITHRAHYTVVAVLLKADFYERYMPAKWKKLNFSPRYGTGLLVNGVILSDYLPADRDYYYYQGSLTTPPCSETVQWFVLKRPVYVNDDFIRTLKNTKKDKYGRKLTFNTRNIQQENRRRVYGCFQGC